MSIKVLLQHNLTLQLGAENGKLIYKIVMLQFSISICALYKEYQTFDIDLLSQMIAKLARRIEKMPIICETTPKDIASVFNSVIKEAKDSIKTIRQKIDSQIKKLQREIEKKSTTV